MTERYVFAVTEVVRVVDGDSLWARLDVGFRQTLLVNIRLAGYDTPERNVKDPAERAKAVEATTVAETWLREAAEIGNLWVRTEVDPDSFGRWLGTIWWEDDAGTRRHLGAHLRAQGLASIWPTRWRDEFGGAQ